MKSAAHQYEDKLLEFAYGELPQHEADAVDAHVRGCDRCAQSLSEIRSVRATMAQLPIEPAPDVGLESLLAYAEQAAKRTSKPAPSIWKRFLMPLASFAALATVGVIGFRANQDFDTSRASAAADTKLEKFVTDEKKTEAPSAPIVAAVPQLEGKEAKNAALDVLREAGGKRGDVWTSEPKDKAAPQSVTRRTAQPAKVAPSDVPVGNDEQVYRENDYSNAAARGGLSKAKEPAPPPPPVEKKPVSDKDIGYGLGSPGSAQAQNAPQGTGSGWTQPPRKEEAKKGRAEEERPAPAPIAVAPAPMPSSSSSYAPSAKKGTKSSLGLRLKSAGSEGASESDDSEGLQKSDALGVNRDGKFDERKRAEARTQSLESARVSSSRGDRLSEIRLLAQVLELGATGYERVEALKRICDAYEALGEPERADPFCDSLTREFPNTAAAKAVEDRRKRVQRAPAPAPRTPAPRKALQVDESKQPAEQSPASSY